MISLLRDSVDTNGARDIAATGLDLKSGESSCGVPRSAAQVITRNVTNSVPGHDEPLEQGRAQWSKNLYRSTP